MKEKCFIRAWLYFFCLRYRIMHHTHSNLTSTSSTVSNKILFQFSKDILNTVRNYYFYQYIAYFDIVTMPLRLCYPLIHKGKHMFFYITSDPVKVTGVWTRRQAD